MKRFAGHNLGMRQWGILVLVLAVPGMCRAGGVQIPSGLPNSAQPGQQPIFNPSILPSQTPFSNPGFQPTFPNQQTFPNPTFPQQFPTQPPIIGPTFPGQQNFSLGVFGSFTSQGMLVKQVVPGSPAEKAGLVPGDLITKIDGMVIQSDAQLKQVLNTSGGLVQMIVRRQNGQVQQVAVNLSSGGGRILAPYLLGIKGNFSVLGMQIQTVYQDTPAAKAGLKVGDFVVKINEQFIGSQQQFFQATASSSGDAVLQVRRSGQMSQMKVRLQLCRFGTLGGFSPVGMNIEIMHPNTPASRAGFQVNDWVLAADNKTITSQQVFENSIDQSQGTWNIRAKKTGGGVGNLQVELMNNSLGCWCEPALGGMRILALGQGTMAANIGLSRGDIIHRVDKQSTKDLMSLQNALEKARGFMTVDYRSALTGQFARLNVNLNQ